MRRIRTTPIRHEKPQELQELLHLTKWEKGGISLSFLITCRREKLIEIANERLHIAIPPSVGANKEDIIELIRVAFLSKLERIRNKKVY